MSIREMLFELKYSREGKAYDYWKIGMASRYGFSTGQFPQNPKAMSPELYEKTQSAPVPEWLKEDYEKKINRR